MFGMPGEGFHQHVLGIAANDLIGTVGLAYATSKLTRFTFPQALVSWLVTAEVMHWYFGVHTKVLEVLGVRPRDCSETETDM